MLEKIPSTNDMTQLIGESLYDVWEKLCAMVDEKYDMEHLWNDGGKSWTYEYKYRRGGKTLCTLYAKENCIGFLIILGKYEREKFEAIREHISPMGQKMYDAATTYHDGKWIMFELVDTTMFDDFSHMLQIKRRPNRK